MKISQGGLRHDSQPVHILLGYPDRRQEPVYCTILPAWKNTFRDNHNNPGEGGVYLDEKEVPAEICTNCGEDYVNDRITSEIMMMADKMSRSGVQIDVRPDV